MYLRPIVATSFLSLLCWTSAAAQDKCYLVDSNLGQLFSCDLNTGAATLIGSTANNGLGTPADLAWRAGYNDLWTIDLAGGEVGTLNPANGIFTPKFTAAVTTGWQAMCWDPFTQKFYAANQTGSNYVIDPVAQTTTLLGAAGAGYSLITGMDVDAAGNVWGIDFSTGNLGRMNKTTGAMTTVVVAGTNIQDIAFDSVGHLFGTNTTTDSLYSIDPSTGTTTLIGAHGAGIQFVKGMEITTQQVDAYVVDSNLDILYWIDQGTGKVSAIASTNNNNLATPADLAWRNDTAELWTIDLSGGEVGTIDRSTGTFTKKFDTTLSGWQAMAWDHVNNRFYAANQSGSNYVLDPGAGTTTLLGAAGAGYSLITGMATDSAGTVWCVDFSTGNLGRLNKTTGAVTTVSTTITSLQGLSFDIRGDLYGTNTSNQTLYRITTSTGAAAAIGTHGSGTQFVKGYAVIRPETNAVLVDSNLAKLFSVNLSSGVATGGASTNNHGLGTPAGLAWRSGTSELYVVDLGGGEVGPLHPATGEFTPYYIAQPTSGWQDIAWDASSQRFFLANQDGNNYSLDPATGVTKLLGPAGFSLITALDVDNQGTLWGIDFSGGALVKINKSTGAGTAVGAPATPANFQGMAFLSTRLYAVNTTTDSLYTINTTTGAATLVGAHGAGVQFAKGFEIITGDCTGEVTTSGTGCSDGIQTLSMFSTGPACIGQTLRVGMNGGRPSYLLMLGFSKTVWGAIPLPLNLGPFGAPSCFVYTSHNILVGSFAQNTSVGINIPNNPFFVGTSVYFQGYELSTAINPLGVASSDLLNVKIGQPE